MFDEFVGEDEVKFGFQVWLQLLGDEQLIKVDLVL